MSQKHIVYLQFGNPGAYPPICHSSRILADAGWKIRHFGLRSPATDALKLPQHSNIDATLFHLSTKRIGRLLNYQQVFAQALVYCLRYKPVAIYASDPFVASTALLLKRATKIPVIYHEHDLPIGPQRATARLSRSRLADEATLRVFPSKRRAQIYKAQTACTRDTLEVANCPSLKEIMTADPKFGEPIRLLYHGSIVPARLPITVIEAIALCDEISEFTLIGYETSSGRGHVDRLITRAKELGCANKIKYLGVQPRNVILERCRLSTIGISLFDPETLNENEEAMPGASVKVFEYLSQGVVPILNSGLGWEPDYINAGYAVGAAPKDSKALAAAFRQAIAKRSQRWFSTVRQRLMDDWNYESQFSKVSEGLEQLL